MKKTLSSFLSILLLLSLFCFSPAKAASEGSDPVPGDVNGDGFVDNKDVVTLFRVVSGTITSGFDTEVTDCNGDGTADNKDVVALFRIVCGRDPDYSPYGIFKLSDNLLSADVSSPHAILIDVNTKEILYLNCDPEEKIYPASTTKILTAIVALKYCDPDVIFRPGDELSLLEYDSSMAYTRPQHELTLEMFIEGMMLPSGCDAAYTIAAGVGRIIAQDDTLSGVEASAVFVNEMNRYGTEVLGLTGSHFSCPDGYHKDDHYTTITDIMTVAYAALSEPLIMKYARLYHDDVTFASGHSTSWSNGNKLLNPNSPYYYKYATGIKTGFTEEAGYCLVSCAELGEKKVMAGIFGAENNYGRFTDSKNLLTAGIEG